MSTRNVEMIPTVDRPISEKNVSGIGSFLGLYGGEHIAATEFVFGATLVGWGCSAQTILLGLLIGNIMAVLSFTLCTATIAVDTRLTLYSYLKKILGKPAQKLYSGVWGICSIVLAASGMCVSATAIREVVGIEIQHEWYPTSVGFVVIVLVLGCIVTFVAANGFDAVSRFSATCVPWMIVIFFIGAVVALPQLAEATGVQISSAADLWNIFDNNVGLGANPDAPKITIFHVICFAWLCNLAWHMGLNDMALFRYAGNYKYGFITSIGMFVGHFFAWVMVAIMGAAAAALLGTSLATLDPGAVTNTVFGLTGICAVIVAGWTTANPTIYRSALSLNVLFPGLTHKQVTYVVGAVMTVLACFPAMTNIGNIVQILGWATVGIGAVCIVEHFLFPKIGWTRHWAMYKGVKVNWAAIITWAVSVIFVFVMLQTGALHNNFIFIPEYIIACVLYIILAGAMGAKGDYSNEEAEELAFQAELKAFVDKEAEEALAKGKEEVVVKAAGFVKAAKWISYAILAAIVVTAIMVFNGAMTIETYKTTAIIMTVVYFALNGSATFIAYKNEAVHR